MIPPIFYYKHPHLADDFISRARDEGAARNSKDKHFDFVMKRASDEAEHTIYKAICKMIHETFQPPFIAIQNLNMDTLKYELHDLSPSLQWRSVRSNLGQCFSDQILKLYPTCSDADRQKMVENFLYLLRSSTIVSKNFASEIQDILNSVTDPTGFLKSNLVETGKALEKCLNSHFREYDFVFIGPKIGIVVIDVKHSFFSQQKHFAKTSRSLPDDFLKGLQQLRSFDAVVDLMYECIGIRPENGSIRKILFTRNLEKKRFMDWYSSLEEPFKAAVSKHLMEADVLWADEVRLRSYLSMNKWIALDPLREKILENGSLQTDVYEAWCPLLVGLASVVTRKTVVEIPEGKVSETMAVLQESDRTIGQDPLELLRHSSDSAVCGKRLKYASRSAIYSGSAAGRLDTVAVKTTVVLSPEQKGALDGPDQQIIIGPAGTGKTIIMQAKALKLLGEGKSVCVLAPPCIAEIYKQIFEQNNFYENYEIMPAFAEDIKKFVPFKLLESYNKLSSAPTAASLDSAIGDDLEREWLNADTKLVQLLKRFDCILMDDMLDVLEYKDVPNSLFTILRFADRDLEMCVAFFGFIMAIFRLKCPEKTVWIALDMWVDRSPRATISQSREERKMMSFRRYLTDQAACDYCTITELHLVLRCGENVFQAAYNCDAVAHLGVTPKLGHKIQGAFIREQLRCNSYADGLQKLWEAVKRRIKAFGDTNMDFGDVAVVAGSFGNSPSIKEFLFKKFDENNIPAAMVANVTPYLVLRYTRPSSGRSHKGRIMIFTPDQISSMEWPIVIFAVYRLYSPTESLVYQDYLFDYRARSRATGKLIEITAADISGFRTDFQRSISESHPNGKLIYKLLEMVPPGLQHGLHPRHCSTVASFSARQDAALGEFKKRQLKQLANMVGDATLLVNISDWLKRKNKRDMKKVCSELTSRIRNRYYSVGEIDLEERLADLPEHLKRSLDLRSKKRESYKGRSLAQAIRGVRGVQKKFNDPDA